MPPEVKQKLEKWKLNYEVELSHQTTRSFESQACKRILELIEMVRDLYSVIEEKDRILKSISTEVNLIDGKKYKSMGAKKAEVALAIKPSTNLGD